MIYNNGTISVHKNHIGNLLFAVVISGLVEDVLEARKIRERFFKAAYGVEVFCPIGYCKADDEKRNPNDIEQCPIGCETCDGDCFYYDEDLN